MANLTRAAARLAAAHGELARQFVHPPRPLPRPPGARGLPVVLWSQVAWDDVWQRPQELARALAREREVIFFSPVQAHDAAGRQWGRRRALRRSGNLTVAAPVILSGEYRLPRLARGPNARLAARWLRALLGGREFALLTNSPFIADAVDLLRPARLAVDLMDDFCAFEWAPPRARESERRLLDAADVVLAATGALEARMIAEGRAPIFLPSGCAVARLVKPATEPPELRDVPRPRLLYVGTLNDRLDGELLAGAARAVPGASLVVVGPVHGSFRAPRWPPGTRLLGLRPHGDLPAFYQHCDVGLAPYADNEAARAINPIKLLEYLACGLPVVSTPLPDITRFYGDVVDIARPAQWPSALARALEDRTPEARARRVAFARRHTWGAAARALSRALDEAGW